MAAVSQSSRSTALSNSEIQSNTDRNTNANSSKAVNAPETTKLLQQQPRGPTNTKSASTRPASPSSQLPSTSTSTSTSTTGGHRGHHHQSSPSISLQRSGGILAFAAAAFDKTIAGISPDQRVRPRQSLSRLSTGPDLALSSTSLGTDKSSRGRPASNYSNPSSTPSEAKPLSTPLSQPYSETDPSRPPPIHLGRVDNNNKMHQTSSRLLRMTDDDRPFTKVSVYVPGLKPSVSTGFCCCD